MTTSSNCGQPIPFVLGRMRARMFWPEPVLGHPGIQRSSAPIAELIAQTAARLAWREQFAREVDRLFAEVAHA
jgi:hypothetical protein